MDNVEFLVLRNLLHNEEYVRKVIPFIKSDYFENRSQKVVYEEILKFVEQYNKPVTKEILCIETEKRQDITDSDFKEITQLISSLEEAPTEFEWLISTTEKWCRDRAIYLALMESIYIADGNDEKKNRDAIPTILSDALAVSFDSHVGHDYLEDYEARYESYHRKEDKIPFDLDYFNKITKGGLPNKTLNIALAGTGVGKSLFMCHMAASSLLGGKNVLYITLEMAEEKIAERIDANLLNVNIQEITDLPKQMFESKVTKLAEKTQGTLIIKEYPTASAHAGHFRGLLNELAIKKSFRPDIIFIDYLNICASSRYRGNSNVNSYSYIKAIAEELRGLAVEAKVPIVSATQTTRSGYGSSDVELTDTSESFGLPATADLMFALISTEELESLGQIMVKQLKNRYNDANVNKRFMVGIDRSKMRLYDCEQSAQNDVVDSGQEEEYNYDEKPKKSFEGFKF
jgi:replicative DNA helicase